jgi:hypothetical protein
LPIPRPSQPPPQRHREHEQHCPYQSVAATPIPSRGPRGTVCGFVSNRTRPITYATLGVIAALGHGGPLRLRYRRREGTRGRRARFEISARAPCHHRISLRRDGADLCRRDVDRQAALGNADLDAATTTGGIARPGRTAGAVGGTTSAANRSVTTGLAAGAATRNNAVGPGPLASGRASVACGLPAVVVGIGRSD